MTKIYVVIWMNQKRDRFSLEHGTPYVLGLYKSMEEAEEAIRLWLLPDEDEDDPIVWDRVYEENGPGWKFVEYHLDDEYSNHCYRQIYIWPEESP